MPTDASSPDTLERDTTVVRTRPRVMLVSHCYSEAGLRRQVDAFARYLDVVFVTPNRSEVLVFPEHRTATDHATRTVAYPRVSLFGDQYWLLSPSLGMRSFRPDLIYVTYDPWSAIFWQTLATASLFAPGAPVVCGIKKNTYRQYPGVRGAVKDSIARAGIRKADHFVAASGKAAELYQHVHGVPVNNISVATRVGVDTAVFERAGEAPAHGGVLIGYCGRLAEHKGVLDLVDAVRIVRARGAEVELSLLGAGELRERLMEISRANPWLEVHDAVPSDQVADFLRQLDLYVLPSRVLPDHEEHDAHALLQAMSCGVPAVGTTSGIIPEILTGPDNALVEPGSPEALAGALIDLIDDPSRRARLAEAGRDAALDRYSLESVARSHAEIFTRFLGRSS